MSGIVKRIQTIHSERRAKRAVPLNTWHQQHTKLSRRQHAVPIIHAENEVRYTFSPHCDNEDEGYKFK